MVDSHSLIKRDISGESVASKEIKDTNEPLEMFFTVIIFISEKAHEVFTDIKVKRSSTM